MNNLNQIINDFLNDKSNQYFINNLKYVIPYCEQLLQTPLNTTTQDNYSKTFNINESIQIIIEFLNSVDNNLSQQFQNIITMKDDSNNPILNFVNGDSTYYEKYPDELTDDVKKQINLGSRVEEDKIYIILNNTLDDIFIIIHEIFHYMNLYKLAEIQNGNIIDIGEKYTRFYLSDTVSIIVEKLLGEYLVKKNYITLNDLNLRLNKRIKTSREDAKAIIVEKALIDIKKQGLIINLTNINQYLKNVKNQTIYQVLLEEFKTHKFTSEIVNIGHLNFKIRQRYVIGTCISNNYSYKTEDIQRFIKLNYEVGNKDADIGSVIKI